MTDTRKIHEGLKIFEKWIPEEQQQCIAQNGVLIAGMGINPSELAEHPDGKSLEELGWQYDKYEDWWYLDL